MSFFDPLSSSASCDAMVLFNIGIAVAGCLGAGIGDDVGGSTLHMPIVGDLWRVGSWNVSALLDRCGHTHGCVFKVWIGSTPCVVINHPEMAHHACMRVSARYAGTGPRGHDGPLFDQLMLPRELGAVLDHGLLVGSGSTWRQARRACELALMHPMSLAAHHTAMLQHAEQLCSSLSGVAASGELVDIQKELEVMNTRLVGSTALGVSFGSFGNQWGRGDATASGTRSVHLSPAMSLPLSVARKLDGIESVAAVSALAEQVPLLLKKCSSWVLMGLLLPLLRPIWRRLLHRYPDSAYNTQVKVCTDAVQASGACLKAWQPRAPAGARRRSTLEPGAGGDEADGVSANSLLGILLDARDKEQDAAKRLTDDEVIAQPLSLVAAGCCTTSSALAFSIYLLSLHPQVEMKLVQEVEEAIVRAGRRAAARGGSKSEAATLDAEEPCCSPASRREDIQAEELPYTEAVLKEAMRMFPPVPFLRRQAPPDGMEVDGYRIPGNTVLLVPVRSFHSSEAYFPQPHIFRPERFLEARGLPPSPGYHDAHPLAPTTPYAYVPFGVGSRMCPAFKFALIQGVLVLATLYSRYTFKLHLPRQVPSLPVSSSINAVPVGVWVKAITRTDDARGAELMNDASSSSRDTAV